MKKLATLLDKCSRELDSFYGAGYSTQNRDILLDYLKQRFGNGYGAAFASDTAAFGREAGSPD